MIWRPWRRIRELTLELDQLRVENRALDHALSQSADRYDKVREMNTQLRRALGLYRNA